MDGYLALFYCSVACFRRRWGWYIGLLVMTSGLRIVLGNLNFQALVLIAAGTKLQLAQG